MYIYIRKLLILIIILNQIIILHTSFFILHFYIYFRYKDFDDIGEFMARSKSRMSISSGIDDLYYNSKVKFPESNSSHVLI